MWTCAATTPAHRVRAEDALAGFLRALGVPGQDIPPEAGERTARYRSLLADKRMLVMLDNAGSADQVRPLLPERDRRPRISRPATTVPPLSDLAAAREWLDSERAALVAAAAHAAAHGWPGHATRLAAILVSYLLNGGHLPEAFTIVSHALGAARHTGDRAAVAAAISQIGSINWQQSRYQQACDHHRQALALFREAGDRAGQARELSNTGLAEAQLGHYEQAIRYLQEAVAIQREIGDRFGEARALGNLGIAPHLQGRYQEAAGYYRQSPPKPIRSAPSWPRPTTICIQKIAYRND